MNGEHLIQLNLPNTSTPHLLEWLDAKLRDRCVRGTTACIGGGRGAAWFDLSAFSSTGVRLRATKLEFAKMYAHNLVQYANLETLTRRISASHSYRARTRYIVEIKLSANSRQGLNRRFERQARLEAELRAWERDRNVRATKVNWQLRTEDARVKLKRIYPLWVKSG